MSEVINALLHEQGGGDIERPTLLLGQFERVGSTFYLDQLEKTNLVHNEPYKLLMPSSWPIAKGYPGRLASVDEFFEDPSISSADKHWFRNFVSSLHHPGDQFVKETNLYLALPQFLESFPHSDIKLLTRNPLGITSSFKRNNLYERWGYANVAEILKIQLSSGRPDNHDALTYMLEQGEEWHEKLAWMIGLNSVLLSRHVKPERVKEVVSYEEDVVPMGAAKELVPSRNEDSIFSTNIRKTHDDFEARLNAEEMDDIGRAMRLCASFVSREFDVSDQLWFDQLYKRHIGSEIDRIPKGNSRTLGNVSEATASALLEPADTTDINKPAERRLEYFAENQNLLWDYSLVTNEQMSKFLQSLLEHGHNPKNNHILLLDSMPPSRGGRIIYDKSAGKFTAAEGFKDHPAYWITWLTAALYAYKEGMRLPSYEEWQTVFSAIDHTAKTPDINHSYAFDDVTPTGVGNSMVPTDFFGNLKIWCSDWSNEYAVSKKVAGISWKNELHSQYIPEGERPYLTNSRILGLRLVCCSECGRGTGHSMDEVALKLEEVMALIDNSDIKTADNLRLLNMAISDTVCPPPCSHSARKQAA